MATKPAKEAVQCFGRKKTAVAVTRCKRGSGLINGCPIELFQPEILRFKIFEPVLLLGKHRFAGLRQSITKALVAFYQKYVDEKTKKEVKDILIRYDRTLLVADPWRFEPKKFGGRCARSRSRRVTVNLGFVFSFVSIRSDHEYGLVTLKSFIFSFGALFG
ncbi:unnamed protein product [Eruca vesicaria subsp. sativa]|uniref:Ribosomal protein S16 n=1 Tax=Eruca vesicaria subsp. sativa TaxID=29727 RepID=A0ABC8JAD1_ERUVS|nr:unnamed protein product [Eruca vesicaria subsp. sativa]